MSNEQELQILQLLANGYKASEIGDAMGLSTRTVEKYIELMKGEYDARNVVHLAVIAVRNKVIK